MQRMYEWGGNFARYTEGALMEYFKHHGIITSEDRAEAVEELWGRDSGLTFLSQETYPLDNGKFVRPFIVCYIRTPHWDHLVSNEYVAIAARSCLAYSPTILPLSKLVIWT